MTLQASGAITLAQIAAEFGKSAPYALSNFYRGGAYVPNIAANTAVPLSGAIKLSDFYSTTSAVTVTSVNAGANIALTINDNTGNWPQSVGSNRTAVPTPATDGNYTYLWTRTATLINNGRPIGASGTTTATINFSVNLDIPAESSNKETWQVAVTDGNGNVVTDTIDVQYTSFDDGA